MSDRIHTAAATLPPSADEQEHADVVARILQEAATARDQSDIAAVCQRITDLRATLSPPTRERLAEAVIDSIQELSLEGL